MGNFIMDGSDQVLKQLIYLSVITAKTRNSRDLWRNQRGHNSISTYSCQKKKKKKTRVSSKLWICLFTENAQSKEPIHEIPKRCQVQMWEIWGKISHFLQQIDKRRGADVNCERKEFGLEIQLIGKVFAWHAWDSGIYSQYQKRRGRKSLLAGYGSKAVIPALGKKDQKFKASLGYIVTWRLA